MKARLHADLSLAPFFNTFNVATFSRVIETLGSERIFGLVKEIMFRVRNQVRCLTNIPTLLVTSSHILVMLILS